jgi:NitT/TauT family transport system substrate-binding protein
MKHRLVKRLAAGAIALSFVAAACSDDSDSSADTTADTTATEETTATGDTTADTAAPAEECTEPTSVKLQLQWFIQAQFAGYFAAQDQGFYEAQCLDVEIVEGGVDIVPQQQLADGAVDFALSWVPKALASREAGADIVNIQRVRTGPRGEEPRDRRAVHSR